jgi:hypothetical protein
MSARRHWTSACRLLFVGLACSGCVQPSYDRTIVYRVDVSKVPDVRTVGIRGGDSPLSWSTDLAMTAERPESLYTATVTYRTGYLATEVKFTVNGVFELQDGENRRVRVAKTTTGGDTTIYSAVFDRR